METQHPITVQDALTALHAIMPALLNIIARQDPQQRRELESALAYAINHSAAEMQGVAKILTTWKESLELANRARLDS